MPQTLLSRILLVIVSLFACAILFGCGGGGDDGGPSIPSDAKVCQMKLYGVAIWGETRPPSELEKKTLRLTFYDGFVPVGGSFDLKNNRRLFHPRFSILKNGQGWALLEVVRPHFNAGPPDAPAKMRIIVDAYEGYRYGKIWSCMVEELDFGSRVYVQATGDETVPATISVEAYTSLADWGNEIALPLGATGIEYFSVPGDVADLELN